MSIIDENPQLIFNNIKELLKLGAINRKHSFHTPVFSNINKNNNVSSRIVVLRKFNEKKLKLNFHTDARSPKIKEIKKNNISNFVFYDYALKIQLRIKTQSKINNKNDVTKIEWDNTRLFSRKCYLTEKDPSSKTNSAEDGIPFHLKGKEPSKEESEKGYNNFAVIENQIKDIDWLYLNSSGHRRLSISFEDNLPIFSWIIP
jgi:pyridoxamine 5'-phosphate oxidase